MSDRGRLVRKTYVRRPVPGIAAGYKPRVSVVIPCFNYARYLPACVGSGLHQTGVEVRVVIVDDASTDNSLAVARGLEEADVRVSVISHRINAGPVASFNDGLAATDREEVLLPHRD